MLLLYEWPPIQGAPPEKGTPVKLSINPDVPELNGEVLTVRWDAEGATLSVYLPDGQPGAQQFQEALELGGDVGLMILEKLDANT